MLYILPPPRAPNPPSPWDSILCSGSGAGAQNVDKPWLKKPPPRAKLRSLQFKIDDSTAAIGDEDMGRNSKSLSECYFAGKGTALVLPAASEAQKTNRRSGAGSNIQKHLQSMFYLLRPEETLKMAVKLESVHPVRTRYLVVVSRMGTRAEESCLLGIDCNEKTTVGLVLKVLADTSITLDGDGGFSVSVCGRHHIFKPVSVQAMWSALQTLHKVSSKAREHNYFQGGLTHSWVNYYEERIESERSCLNEWHAMDNLESRRPPSPDSARTKPTQIEDTERVIRSTLKEIMMSVDLDEVTSKYIRSRLEEDLNMDLGEFKSFIDEEMLTILGQMDAPTEIFDHVYLGSEWNASNYEELQRNGVGHILNVTREIDNFFPGTFDYLNIRVYDDEKTDLLKYWDDTFKYITKARKQGSKVLVHCKMGVSRSASVVIAYAMKAYNWDFGKAMQHVKEKRSCIKPNTSFLSQLETYQGILDAMKNKEKLQRSKSETNLKSPSLVAKNELVLAGSEPTPIVQMSNNLQTTISGHDLRCIVARPKSWSPDNTLANTLLTDNKSATVFRSLENLNQRSSSRDSLKLIRNLARNVLLPCDNGESYSVSPNQIMHIPNGNLEYEQCLASVKERVNELEAKKSEKKKLVLNLMPQFESSNKTNNEVDSSSNEAQTNLTNQVITNTDTWDPGEKTMNLTCSNGTTNDCDLKSSASDEEILQNEGSTVPEVRLRSKRVRKDGDPFSNQLDRVFDREERKQQRVTIIGADNSEDTPRNCPSRQSSWSSYDSAVVLGYQGETREAPSRHSSWGSGDTRTCPSRNSSWGSYDMRSNEKPSSSDLIENSSCGIFPYDKEEIPWYPGTVKRTKQKLEESSGKQTDDRLKLSNEALEEPPSSATIAHSDGTLEAVNTVLINEKSKTNSSNHVNITSAITKNNIDVEINSRLSVSAPENSAMEFMTQASSLSRSASNIGKLDSNIISTAQCSSVKQHKTYLENLHKDMNKKDEVPDLETNLGLVKILKKEFEAKTNVERVNQINLNNTDNINNEDKKNKVNSLPSSPNNEKDPASPTSSDPGEDLNFRELLGKFENQESQVHPKLVVKPHKNPRYCYEVVDKSPLRIMQSPYISNYNNKNPISEKNVEGEFKRPPIVPVGRNTTSSVVVATVIKAAKKQQQFGKSHPLARINIKPRHNNPVYNTM